MSIHKLLNLAALLTEYAQHSSGSRQLMARYLSKIVTERAKVREYAAWVGEQCDLS